MPKSYLPANNDLKLVGELIRFPSTAIISIGVVYELVHLLPGWIPAHRLHHNFGIK